MKAFHFKLDPALRWRATELRLEREGVSRAANQAAVIQSELIAKHNELRSGSSQLVAAGSAAFGSWAAYVDRSRRRIRLLEEQLKGARKALAVQTQKMVDAHRKLRILENLKRDNRADWEKELDRETEAFAGEAFLARLSRNSRAAAAEPVGRDVRTSSD
jgi:hypothetical protein